MAQFHPFRAIRPEQHLAKNTACLPYDVLSEQDVKELAENPFSFVHVIRAEADLPSDYDPYADIVYETARNNLRRFLEEGIYVQEKEPCYFLYREITPDHIQTGFAGCASCREYETGTVRRHELTVPIKEDDRTRHIIACRAQTGPVFLTFPENPGLRTLIERITSREPLYDFEQDGIRHQVWKISAKEEVAETEELFAEIPVLYIADGHHRAASSLRAAKELNAADAEEAGRFMAVAFPAEDLFLLGYHRYVRDLNGRSEEAFLNEVKDHFDVTPVNSEAVPSHRHEIILQLNDRRYSLIPHSDIYDDSDSISRLDVTILQDHLLAPLLGIDDPRRDPRIVFLGGEGAERELDQLVRETGEGAGFLLYPTDIHDLLAAADEHRIMPPKSTWFEPKLLSGLFIHSI